MWEDSTWNAMKRTMSTQGYREGAEDGRNSLFQNGFDDGFAEGLRIGKLLGSAQGAIEIAALLKKPTPEFVITDPTKGNCNICQESGDKAKAKAPLPDTVYEASYDQLKSTQRAHNEELEAKINNSLRRLSR